MTPLHSTVPVSSMNSQRDTHRLSVVVITQNDSLVIPENVIKIIRSGFVDLRAVVVVDGAAAVGRRKWQFLRGFGLIQTLSLARRMISTKMAIRFGQKKDLKGAADLARAAYVQAINLHDQWLISYLTSMKPDVIASFSAPTIFKKSVLEIPRLGCVNLHCSLLPKYAGLLPSFWVLFNGESTAGASVHYMDDKIDNGEILGQCSIDIPEGTSMYDLIRLTKDIGGDLMVQVLRELHDGVSASKPNRAEDGSYFSWPTIDQMREFRFRGGRLA